MKYLSLFLIGVSSIALSACSHEYRSELVQGIRDMDGYLHNQYEFDETEAVAVVVVEKEPEMLYPTLQEPIPYDRGIDDRSHLFKEKTRAKP